MAIAERNEQLHRRGSADCAEWMVVDGARIGRAQRVSTVAVEKNTDEPRGSPHLQLVMSTVGELGAAVPLQ